MRKIRVTMTPMKRQTGTAVSDGLGVIGSFPNMYQIVRG